MINILVTVAAYFITSFYNLQFVDTDGNTVNMSNYQNKKILLVNIATNSSKINQLTGLQQLQQQYGDSVSVIAFPSNSFGNEPRTNVEIKQFCQNNYNTTFKLAAKNSVSGNGLQSIYSWLSQVSENGVMNVTVFKDFQKILIDRNGIIIGVYSASVSPMDSVIINAINN